MTKYVIRCMKCGDEFTDNDKAYYHLWLKHLDVSEYLQVSIKEK